MEKKTKVPELYYNLKGYELTNPLNAWRPWVKHNGKYLSSLDLDEELLDFYEIETDAYDLFEDPYGEDLDKLEDKIKEILYDNRPYAEEHLDFIFSECGLTYEQMMNPYIC